MKKGAQKLPCFLAVAPAAWPLASTSLLAAPSHKLGKCEGLGDSDAAKIQTFPKNQTQQKKKHE